MHYLLNIFKHFPFFNKPIYRPCSICRRCGGQTYCISVYLSFCKLFKVFFCSSSVNKNLPDIRFFQNFRNVIYFYISNRAILASRYLAGIDNVPQLNAVFKQKLLFGTQRKSPSKSDFEDAHKKTFPHGILPTGNCPKSKSWSFRYIKVEMGALSFISPLQNYISLQLASRLVNSE